MGKAKVVFAMWKGGGIMGWLAIVTAWGKSLDFAMRIWDYMNGRPRAKLEQRRILLEEESRTMQLTGDLTGLRRVRAQLEEIDRKLRTNDY